MRAQPLPSFRFFEEVPVQSILDFRSGVEEPRLYGRDRKFPWLL